MNDKHLSDFYEVKVVDMEFLECLDPSIWHIIFDLQLDIPTTMS